MKLPHLFPENNHKFGSCVSVPRIQENKLIQGIVNTPNNNFFSLMINVLLMLSIRLAIVLENKNIG